MKTVCYILLSPKEWILIILSLAISIALAQISFSVEKNNGISSINHRQKADLPRLSNMYSIEDDKELHQLYNAKKTQLKEKHIQQWEPMRNLKGLAASKKTHKLIMKMFIH